MLQCRLHSNRLLYVARLQLQCLLYHDPTWCHSSSFRGHPSSSLVMVNVRQVTPQGGVALMEVAFVSGRMVRYVHIPDDVDAIRNLQKHMRVMGRTAREYSRNMLKVRNSPTPR
ncbi:unnamed protein product [Choristocarpus tenellus]